MKAIFLEAWSEDPTSSNVIEQARCSNAQGNDALMLRNFALSKPIFMCFSFPKG